ncbi:MAG: S9 family peptidase [Pseudomonadales bacterium]|nr:S9 family peptidase [Pseudomonadales bacterium]
MLPPKSSAENPVIESGYWESPITAIMVAQQRNSVQDLISSGNSLLWIKCMTSENGRFSLHSLPTSNTNSQELSPSPFNVRSKIHEYGGGPCLYTDDTIFFSNFDNQRLYRLDLKNKKSEKLPQPQTPYPVTPEGPFRYADAIWDAKRKRIICIMEDHSDSPNKPTNTLVSICPERGITKDLCKGADFYASPTISHCGNKLSWLTWNHPFMPWDSTYLWCAEFNSEGELANTSHIAGSDEESVIQPRWGNDNTLYFVSDRSNWWNIYHYKNGQVIPVYPAEAEFGKPMWVLGQHTYDITKNGDIVAAYSMQGQWYIGLLSKENFGHTQTLKPLLGPYPDIKKLFITNDKATFIAGQSKNEDHICQYDLNTNSATTLVGAQDNSAFSKHISKAERLRFKTADGSELNGFYYAPHKRHYNQPPPLIIKTHGGPSSCANSSLDLSIQFWSSRGFAVFDINYRGSTGFGRSSRKKLYGNWGVADVEDCIYATKFLIQTDRAHPEQLIIRGHSAGGYTTLAALTFSTTFHAGASYYGISDLKSLAEDCHKFESFYVQQLLGESKLSAPIYEERSPLFHVNQMNAPSIFFQGSLDKVVPPNQAQVMVSALKKKNIPVKYFEFAEEAHGFHKNKNIETALNSELRFYRDVLHL